MKEVNDFFEAKQKIYDHVGFVEDWVYYPIENLLDCYWRIESNEVVFGEKEEDVKERNGENYSYEIYTQRFYSQHVYRGAEYTMIFCDSHTDGMKYFSLFSNKLEVSNDKMD